MPRDSPAARSGESGRICPEMNQNQAFSSSTNSLQVPVEMSVLSSQPFFKQSGIVDATQFGNIPDARFRSTKFFIPGGSDDGAVRTVRTARTANRRITFARL